MRKHNNLHHRSCMLHWVIANLVPHRALRFTSNLALESGPHHEAQPSTSPELHVPSRFVCKGVLPLRGMANKFQWAGDLEPMNPCGFLHPVAPLCYESHSGLGARNVRGVITPWGASCKELTWMSTNGGPWTLEFLRISTPGDLGC